MMAAPIDLWAFWDATKAELNSIPAEPEMTPAPEISSETALVYYVSFASLGGYRVRGWYITPPVPAGMKLAGMLWLPGYGTAGDATGMLEWASRGFATLVLLPRGQGPGKPFPDGSDGKLVHEITDIHRYAYRSVVMDCVRGLQFLRDQAEVRPERIAVVGGSQGGGLALMTASVCDEDIRVVAAHVPFLCHFDWVIEHAVQTNPYNHLTKYLEEYPERRGIVRRTLSYFDPVNLVSRLTAPTFLTAGVRDTTCPRETIGAVFEAITGKKAILVEPEAGHEWLDDTNQHILSWLTHYLR
jgi:cephalosporin-C deacetylase